MPLFLSFTDQQPAVLDWPNRKAFVSDLEKKKNVKFFFKTIAFWHLVSNTFFLFKSNCAFLKQSQSLVGSTLTVQDWNSQRAHEKRLTHPQHTGWYCMFEKWAYGLYYFIIFFILLSLSQFVSHSLFLEVTDVKTHRCLTDTVTVESMHLTYYSEIRTSIKDEHPLICSGIVWDTTHELTIT